MSEKIKVLIVDDSKVMQKILEQIIKRDQEVEVVGVAANGIEADKIIKDIKPDVITLDLEMPGMDGLTFLKKLKGSIPAIIISKLTKHSSDLVVRCLDSGAVDVINKYDGKDTAVTKSDEIVAKIKEIGRRPKRRKVACISTEYRSTVYEEGEVKKGKSANDKLILLGASTGGVHAYREILSKLPKDTPGVCVVQHMPEICTASFAKRLNELCQMDVKEAEDGDRVKEGQIIVAKGGFHMELKKDNSGYYIHLDRGEKVHNFRPAVDVLFESAAKVSGSNVIGVLLTGIGNDGARGLLALKKNGAKTIAQDEETSVVYGMPKVAHELGAAQNIVPLGKVASRIISLQSYLN